MNPWTPLIICEIGINASGNLNLAQKLIDMAIDCGADAVKFQKRTVDVVYTKEFLASPRESPFGTTQRDQKEALEFGKAEYDVINEYCTKKDIQWFASAWDMKSVEFLKQYDLPYNKIASAILTHREIVTSLAGQGKHTFISTGMSEWSDIDFAVNCFKRAGTSFTLMHCCAEYPAPDEHLNLIMIQELKRRYGCPVGFSSHSPGILAPSLAVALGAEAIEVHITLDRSSYGSDQSSSLEKRGLELVVRDCRLVGTMFGSRDRVIYPEELKIAAKLRYWQQGVYA